MTTQLSGGRSVRSWMAPLACVAVVVVWLAMPAYTLTEAVQRAWLDQSILLASLEDLVTPGAGEPALVLIGTGPAYLALARLLTMVGLDSAEALVALSRLALLSALLLTLSSALGRRRGRLEVSWSSFGVVTLLALLVPLAFLSGIPWTHFPAAALSLGMVVGVRLWRSHPTLSSVVVGSTFAALLQTRNFEAQVLLVAAVSVMLVAVIVGRLRGTSLSPQDVGARSATLLASFAAVWVAVGLATGQWAPYSQYSAQWTDLDRELSVESLLSSVPQVFLDPCYGTPCGSPGSQQTIAVMPTSTEAWSAPLVHQLPSLVVGLPAAWVLVLERLIRRRHIAGDTWLSLLASSVLVVGYLANPIMGGPHLPYGVVRDFVLPALLAVYAVGRLVRAQAREDQGSGSRRATLYAVVISSATLLLSVVPIPRLESDPVVGYQVNPSTCTSWPCSFELSVERASGSSEPVESSVIVVPFCDGTRLARIDPRVAIPGALCDGALELGVLPRSFGAWQTPEGEAYLRSHLIRVGG